MPCLALAVSKWMCVVILSDTYSCLFLIKSLGCKATSSIGAVCLPQCGDVVLMILICIQGKDHSILATLHRPQSELSSTLNKVFKIDDHMGIAVSGVAADGRLMCRFMRGECLSHQCAPSLQLLCRALAPCTLGSAVCQ